MNVNVTSRRSFAVACLTAITLATGCSTSALPPTASPASTGPSALAVREDASITKNPLATMLMVNVNSPVITVVRGSSTSDACALTIATNDTVDAKYMVTGWGTGTVAFGTAPFPVENYPTRSFVSWSLDNATTTTVLANSGSPGQRFITSIPSSNQSHCLSLTIQTPANLAPGTYTLSIDFHLLAGSGSLLSLRATRSAVMSVIVS